MWIEALDTDPDAPKGVEQLLLAFVTVAVLRGVWWCLPAWLSGPVAGGSVVEGGGADRLQLFNWRGFLGCTVQGSA
jgi:hypothetical protein